MTSRYRWFTTEASIVLPDQSLVAIFLETWTDLGVLSSRLHEEWFIENCGWLGVGNDPKYNPTTVFDTFPFPDPSPAQRAAIAEIAEELDATRKLALAENDKLTMTGLYNLVAAIRDGTLSPDREAQAVRARARIVAKLHDDLDGAVAAGYGWPADLPPAEIVARLVALNAERAAEEKAGKVRWLRPDYQIPRFARSSGVQES